MTKKFIEWLDDEDMALCIKEWTLSGFTIKVGNSPENEKWKYVDVWNPDQDSDNDAEGAYIQRLDGYWIKVSHEAFPKWVNALKYADEYEVPGG